MIINLSQKQADSVRQMGYAMNCDTEKVLSKALALLKVCLEEKKKGLEIASVRHHSIRKIINV